MSPARPPEGANALLEGQGRRPKGAPVCRLLLIRHGETPLNVARVLQPPDTPLSDRGQQQAEALGRRLAADAEGDGRVAAVLSSDLARAWQTAQAVARACGIATVAPEPLLHERNFGDLRGRPYDSLGYDPIHDEGAPPGGESMATFRARCEAAWQAVLAAWQAQAGGGTLAVVTHGLVLRTWLASGRIALPAGTEAPAQLANTGLSVVAAEAPHVARLVNCAAHLSADHAARGLAGA